MQIIVIEIIFVKGFQPTLFKTQILSQITYINSWDISRLIFRERRMTFFHKIMVAEKYFSNASHNFPKSKVISECKMINLQKNK